MKNRYRTTPTAFLLELFYLFLVPCLLRQGNVIFVDSALTDGRHSYSLTTFDPDGKLGQVERALVAASLGTPIIGIVKGDSIVLASPQILPSPLMNDDGTSRFAVASPQIVLGHSGIASDGRVVMESAQRLAIEHSYTYDEPIPIDLFLEELSLLFQSYTMRPGARPFGCSLLVGYLPPPSSRASGTSETPRLFKIECSGSVVELDKIAIINGNFQGTDLKSKLLHYAKEGDEDEIDGRKSYLKKKDYRNSVSRMLKEALKNTGTPGKTTRKTKSSIKDNQLSTNEDDFVVKSPLRIVSASFDPEEGFAVEQISASKEL